MRKLESYIYMRIFNVEDGRIVVGDLSRIIYKEKD